MIIEINQRKKVQFVGPYYTNFGGTLPSSGTFSYNAQNK
jgi:hypothetical protein